MRSAGRGGTTGSRRSVRTPYVSCWLSWLGLPHAEQHFHCQLVEALVAKSASGEGLAIECGREQRVPLLLRILRKCRRGTVEGSQNRLNLGVCIPLPGTVAQDEVRPHAAARELADARVILRAIGVRIEVSRTVVPDILQELHQPERPLDV